MKLAVDTSLFVEGWTKHSHTHWIGSGPVVEEALSGHLPGAIWSLVTLWFILTLKLQEYPSPSQPGVERSASRGLDLQLIWRQIKNHGSLDIVGAIVVCYRWVIILWNVHQNCAVFLCGIKLNSIEDRCNWCIIHSWVYFDLWLEIHISQQFSAYLHNIQIGKPYAIEYYALPLSRDRTKKVTL